MAEFKATRDQIGNGIKVPVGSGTVVRVAPNPVSRVRLVGMFFDLNKCFLLPSAVPGIRKIKGQYDKHPKSNLLIVGHTDTSGQDDYNLTLSLERADAVAAYLSEKVAAWEAFFGSDKPEQKRWGALEIQSMLSILPDPVPATGPFFPGTVNGVDDGASKAAVLSFQKSEGLKEDGLAGPATRKVLIARYMDLDKTKLPAGIKITTHGCGENFPVKETKDDSRSPEHRRVEAFFFIGPILPAPPGKTSRRGSKEYPKWLGQVSSTIDFADNGPPRPPGPFRYGLPVGGNSPWTNNSVLRIVSDDGTDDRRFPMSQGEAIDNFRFFVFPNTRPGLLYKGFVEDGATSTLIFGSVELAKVEDPDDDTNGLPLPAAPPQPDEVGADPVGPVLLTGPDTGIGNDQAVADASRPAGDDNIALA